MRFKKEIFEYKYEIDQKKKKNDYRKFQKINFIAPLIKTRFLIETRTDVSKTRRRDVQRRTQKRSNEAFTITIRYSVRTVV